MPFDEQGLAVPDLADVYGGLRRQSDNPRGAQPEAGAEAEEATEEADEAASPRRLG